MAIDKAYNLVHITTSGEYKAPLVASQLFDQAEFQAVVKDGFAPGRVEAWIIGSMREYVDKPAQEKINSLKKRCPHIGIRMLNGIGSLKNFPALALLKRSRLMLGKKTPVVYHCRGEAAAKWALLLRDAFPGDKVVLDVRGYWPAELLYNRGIYDPAEAKGKDLADYEHAYAMLKTAIGKVDAVTTVSDALRALLIKEMHAPAQTYVVPCCINQVTGDEKRAEIRKSWGLKDDEIALVYSGTTAAYQHLDDLTIPFLHKMVRLNSKIRLVFLSSESDKIKGMLDHSGINTDNIILRSLQQKEVAASLTACDAGILIRKPTLVNRVANPVKIAEYLASGLPIIIEKGVGGVADSLFDSSLLKGIEIAVPGGNMDVAARDVNDWLNTDLREKRNQVRAYAKEVYLWSAAIHVSRKMYHDVLMK